MPPKLPVSTNGLNSSTPKSIQTSQESTTPFWVTTQLLRINMKPLESNFGKPWRLPTDGSRPTSFWVQTNCQSLTFHWQPFWDLLSDWSSTKRIEKIFLTWPDGSKKFQTWRNSKLTSESSGFAKRNSFQNSLDLNQYNKKRRKKRSQRIRLQSNKKNQPKRNNNQRRRNNQRNKKRKKLLKRKITCQRRRPTHWMFYQNPHSTLKIGREKSATLKISSVFWKNSGPPSILKDGLSGEFTT